MLDMMHYALYVLLYKFYASKMQPHGLAAASFFCAAILSALFFRQVGDLNLSTATGQQRAARIRG
jgi:hypothetical protein